MGTYRISRAIEASLCDFLQTQFDLNWTGITVEKGFAQDDVDLPAVCVRVSDTDHKRVELGTTSTMRTPLILLDIFSLNDGQRLDMKDFLIDEIRAGINYYTYTIVNGVVDTKVLSGRISVLNIDDTPIDFNVDKNVLSKRDRYRHLITLDVSLSIVEA